MSISDGRKACFLALAFAVASLCLVTTLTKQPILITEAQPEPEPERMASSFRFDDVDVASIAVIGAKGYVGSFLQRTWVDQGFAVVGFDRNMATVNKGLDVRTMSSTTISTAEIRSHRVVVFLGGLTGRPECDQASPHHLYEENVNNVLNLARQMLPNQLLLFASTSAIAEGPRPNGRTASEDDTVQVEKLDNYSLSMYRREKALSEFAQRNGATAPKLVGFRFGTVVGVSPSQRTRFAHVAMLRSAFLTEHVSVQHGETRRAILWLPDLARALGAVILQPSRVPERFTIFNLQSFSTTINAAANEVAAQSGVSVEGVDHFPRPDIHGFHLDMAKFGKHFPNITLEGTQGSAVKSLVQNVHHIVVGRDITHRPLSETSDASDIPLCPAAKSCVVCGSRDLSTVLDLGAQPLANAFSTTLEESLRMQRYPLRLARCRKCHHTQLSHIVDRGHLFNTYRYRSGTSRTLREYFAWLARKVDNETTSVRERQKTVLELACNDGTQLNEFAAIGWRTFGVDPADNLAQLRSPNHTVFTGLWGITDARTYKGLPQPDELSAIVAQNVVAHTTDPLLFLKATAEAMGLTTLLYLQTSQCKMHDYGQFDTIYHEHVSFFTLHSFRELARRAGLVIINYEITPIHGESCLLTMMRRESVKSLKIKDSFERGLKDEKHRGITSDWFFVRYRERAHEIRQWVDDRVRAYHHASKYRLVAYGAAAKGMVMLHFLSTSQYFEFVVDDEPMKQNTFCAGTSIPVRPTSALAEGDGHMGEKRSLVILVLAWNFFPEIASRVKVFCPMYRDIIGIVPFFEGSGYVRSMCTGDFVDQGIPPHSLWHLPSRQHTTQTLLLATLDLSVISRTFLQLWVQHHAHQFHRAILFLGNPTDRNPTVQEHLEDLRTLVPSTWEIRQEKKEQNTIDNSDFEVVVELSQKQFLLAHPTLRNSPSAETSRRTAINLSIVSPAQSKLALSRFIPFLRQYTNVIVSPEFKDRTDVGQGTMFIFTTVEPSEGICLFNLKSTFHTLPPALEALRKTYVKVFPPHFEVRGEHTSSVGPPCFS